MQVKKRGSVWNSKLMAGGCFNIFPCLDHHLNQLWFPDAQGSKDDKNMVSEFQKLTEGYGRQREESVQGRERTIWMVC